MELTIILDKSVVHGLNNFEIDSLDKYFHLLVPPILTNEILAGLSKETEEPSVVNQIAGHSYRISGNRGLPVKYTTVLELSLRGNEVPMDGRYLPEGDSYVRSANGTIGRTIDTTYIDEYISRWERKQFTQDEGAWAVKWRRVNDRFLTPKLYLENIAKAGLEFAYPQNADELVDAVDALLNERKMQVRLFPVLAKQHKVSRELQELLINRWFKAGKPMFQEFAPYTFYCLRTSFIWSLSYTITNSRLFRPDLNDRKDMEYCYYLPHCEVFSSVDNKHKALVPYLLRSDQSFIDGTELKKDLRRLSEEWDSLSQEEKICYHYERGNAPPENENCKIFQLWKKHRNKINKPYPPEILDIEVYDVRNPEKIMTFGDVLSSL